MVHKPSFADPVRVMMIGAFPTDRHRLDGGVAAAMTYLCEAMTSERGIDLVGVRIAKDQDKVSGSDSFGWPIIDVPLGKGSLSTFYRRQLLLLRAAVDRFQPDIVHGQGADIAGYLAVRSGRPSVVTVHGLLAECARFQTDPVMRIRAALTARLTERSTIRRASDLIAISPFVTRYYRGDIRGHVHDIPNAVSQVFFNVSRAAEPGRYLYAGRVSNGKGLPDLFQAIARDRTAVSRLIVAGANHDPGYAGFLEKLIVDLGLTDVVRFAGLLDEPALIREFARATALILPSHQETAPMVVQQAMAAGLPVIATDVGGIPAQIDHDVTGLLFRPGDDGQLAALLARFASERGLGTRLGAAAKSVAETRFTASSVAQATLAVYRLIRSSRAAGEAV